MFPNIISSETLYLQAFVQFSKFCLLVTNNKIRIMKMKCGKSLQNR
nr:MAG TPA: hypothetical protein [Caudoviricetes sp.]